MFPLFPPDLRATVRRSRGLTVHPSGPGLAWNGLAQDSGWSAPGAGDQGPQSVGLTEAQSPWLQGTRCRRPAPGQAGFSAIDRVPETNLSADRVGNPGPTLTVPEDPVGALCADFSPSARGVGIELAFAGFWRSPRASPRELQRPAPERGP